MLFKNAAQKVHVYAYLTNTGNAKAGDAGNITAWVSLDGTANKVDNTHPVEIDATNMAGVYVFNLTAAETSCNAFALAAKSNTTNVRLDPIIGFTSNGYTNAKSAYLDASVSSRSVVTNASAQVASNAALTAKGLTIAGVAALSKVTNASAQTACNSSLTARGLTAANVAAFSRVTNASVKTACNTAVRVAKLAAVLYGKTVANTNTVKFYSANNVLAATIVYNATDGGRDTVTLS